jgi:hypothetical protein
MKLIASVALISILAMTPSAYACQNLRRAFFEFKKDEIGEYKGGEKLRYFIGEVIVFYRKDEQPHALLRVIRDYGVSDFSAKLELRLPKVASMKIGGFDTTCGGYELSEGDIGVYAAYEMGGEIWLAWYPVSGF